MIESAVFLGAGILLGVFTGLLPGLHPNTMIFGSLPFYLSSNMFFQNYILFVIGMSVSHTFHDFLPAIYLGAPEAETALSTLPGGRLAARGEGPKAFHYSVHGGVYSVLVLTVLSPVLLAGLEPFYARFSGLLPYALLFFLSLIVFRSEKLVESFTVAALASLLGILSFDLPINQHYVLVPVFTGLFAVPSILHAYRTDFDIPGQKPPRVREGKAVKGGLTGSMAGLIAGTVPGIGGAIATTFLSPLLDREEEFIAALGGVNTSDILVSFLTVYIIGRARSGAAVAALSIQRLGPDLMILMAGAALLAVSVSSVLAVVTSRYFLDLLDRWNLQKVLLSVGMFVLAATLFLTGLRGVLVLGTSTAIGVAALVSGHRANCMAVLIVPVMLSSTGIFI